MCDFYFLLFAFLSSPPCQGLCVSCVVRRKGAINALLCFLEGRNAGGLLTDEEAVMRDQMEDAGTVSVGETGSVRAPALASGPVRWGRVEGSCSGLGVPKPLDNGQHRKCPLTLKASPHRNTAFGKEPQRQESRCLHSDLEHPGASVFCEIAFHFPPLSSGPLRATASFFGHQFLILLRVFVFFVFLLDQCLVHE